jgi:HEAT repeat protein
MCADAARRWGLAGLVGLAGLACATVTWRAALPPVRYAAPPPAADAILSSAAELSVEASPVPPFAPQVTTHAAMRAVIADLQRAGAERVPELLDLACTARDPVLAGNALRALGRLRAAWRPQVFALCADARPRVRQEAVVALGESGDPRATPALAALLLADDVTLRLLAICALRRIGGAAGTCVLAAHARRPSLAPVEAKLLALAPAHKATTSSCTSLPEFLLAK